MKRCPVCQSTFEDRVDFCFQDGTPLEAWDGASSGDDLTSVPTPGGGGTEAQAPGDLTASGSKLKGRGMFSRPSVADMLSVPEPGQPPTPERRVKTPSSGGPAETPIAAVDVPSPPAAESKPESDPLGLPSPSISIPTSSLASDEALLSDDTQPMEILRKEEDEVPSGETEVTEIHASAVEVPEPQAPPLEDSWFGEDTDLFDAPDPGHADVAIEDPGFADAGPLPGDDVGFDDSSFSLGGSTTNEGPPWKIIGGIAAIAAVGLVAIMMSGGEEAPPVVAQVETPPPPPPPVQPQPVEEIEEVVAEDTQAGGDTGDAVAAADEVDGEDVVAEEDDSLDAVAVVIPPEPEPTPAPPAAPPPPPTSPPPARPPAPPPAPAPAAPPPSVWTGAPTPAASEPAAPAAASPWGAPTEAVSRGSLTITTEPSGAMVYVDERRVGRSPTRTEVSFGSHAIRAELDDYQTNSRTINVQVAEVAVPFRLETASLAGQCNLLGEPGASVAMDGGPVGNLPITVPCLPGGHRFEVMPGSGVAFTVSKTVSFSQAGETVVVFLNPS